MEQRRISPGKNIANPTSLLMSGIMMLRHLGLLKEARAIEGALLYTIEKWRPIQEILEIEVFLPSIRPAFAKAIIGNLGKLPSNITLRETEDRSEFHLPVRPDHQRVMIGHTSEVEVEGN